MPDERQRDSIDIFRRLIEGRRISVRYGRARLTVSQSGEWSERDLGPAIERFEMGEIDAEALACVFIRSRVVKHTPSFSWDDAELLLLLDRVVGVSTEPIFESSAPDDVAEVLVETARVGREARARLRDESERWGRNMSDRLGLASSLRPIVGAMNKHALTNYFKGVIGPDSKIYESSLEGLAHGNDGSLVDAMGVGPRSAAIRRGKLASFTGDARSMKIWGEATKLSTQTAFANELGKINKTLVAHPAVESFARESAETLAGLRGHPSFAAFRKEFDSNLSRAGKGWAAQIALGSLPSTLKDRGRALEVCVGLEGTRVLGLTRTGGAEELLSQFSGAAGAGVLSAERAGFGVNGSGLTGLTGDERWRGMVSDLHLGVTRLKFPAIGTGMAAAAPDARFEIPTASAITTTERTFLEPPLRRHLAPPVVPENESTGLAEVTAAVEARSNRHAAEDLLRDEGMHYELEHLQVIADCLEAKTKSGRVHAAMSASIVFKAIANAFFPGRPNNPWVDRWRKAHEVDKKDVRNRIAALIDTGLRTELSTHEHKRLQGMIDFSHNWSGEGHHTPYSTDQANRAYRDLLVVLAYVARARTASLS